ncbi:MMPL family transporter, partial [Rhodococcus sp. NPDC058514]
MIDVLPRLAMRAPKVVLALTALAFVVCGIAGSQVTSTLSSGGFLDPHSESSRAAQIMAEEFQTGGMQLIFTVESPRGTDSPAARDRGESITSGLASDPEVEGVMSPWANPEVAPRLISTDGQLGVVIASVRGDDNTAPPAARELADRYVGTFGDVTVTAGGQALVFHEIHEQAARDLMIAEAVAVPITLLLLLWFLKSFVAAIIPVITGAVAIVGTTAILTALTFVVDLSVFALNLTTALGLALAIDYSLLIISRFREEIDSGADEPTAIRRALRHGGRAVVFSAATVALSLIGTLFFPMYFLRSMAYAGVAVVGLSVLLALTCVPALLTLAGKRIRPRRAARAPIETSLLYRSTRAAQRRPVLVALAVLASLGVLGLPILGIRMGLPDDRVLPSGTDVHVVGDAVRTSFDEDATGAVTIVLPEVRNVQRGGVEE